MSKRQLLNVIPNFAGVAAGLIFPLLFNVVYFRLLETEAYGLIGFYGLLTLLASLADLGLSQTTMREVARRAGNSHRSDDLQSLVLTLALLSLCPGALMGLLAVASSRWLATSWLSLDRLSVDEVATAIALMGGALALIFPASILTAALRGLQRQVAGNAVVIALAACRGLATIVALYAFGVTPRVFFSAQLILSVLEVVVLAVIVWMLLPPSRASLNVDLQLLRRSWEFTFTMWLSVLIGQIIMLSDRIVMSTLLPLDLFGLYSLAFAVASTVQRMATPFSNAFFPHFVELLEERNQQALAQAYQLATRLTAAAVLPFGLSMAVYSQPIMTILTGSPAASQTIAPVFAILAIANMLAALMVLPNMLQLACGAPWIALRVNFFQAVPYVVLLLLLAPRYGMYAPAGLWLATTTISLPIMAMMTHRFVLQGQAWSWANGVIFLPGLASAVVLIAGAALSPASSTAVMLPWLAANYALALLAALLLAFRGSIRSLVASRPWKQ